MRRRHLPFFPYLGTSSRANYYDALSAGAKQFYTCQKHTSRVLPLPNFRQHNTSPVRLLDWQLVPRLDRDLFSHPVPRSAHTSGTSQHNHNARLAFRLRILGARRLLDFRPCEILQAPSRDGIAHNSLQQALPA